MMFLVVETVKSEHSRAPSRVEPNNFNPIEPVEIPESRATINNFVS